MCFYFPPKPSGMLSYFNALRAALEPHGWEVLLACAGRAAAARVASGYDEHFFRRIAPEEDDPRRAVAALLGWLEEEDVSLFHAYGSTEIGDLALPHVPRRTRTLVSVHANTWGAIRIAAAQCQHADAFVAVNEIQRRRLIRAGVQGDRISIIPHGVADHGSTARVSHPDGFLRLAYVGALERHKGADLILPIARELQSTGIPFQWTVAGAGTLSTDLARGATALAPNAVRLEGLVDAPRAREIMASADIVVVPSRTESFCYTLAEAMAAERAVVAARLDGVTDCLVQHGRSGLLVRPGDVRGFAGGVIALHRSPERRQLMAMEARKRIVERFSIHAMGRAYASLLANVASSPDRRPSTKPLEMFQIPASYVPGAGRFVPPRVKEWIRTIAARIGIQP